MFRVASGECDQAMRDLIVRKIGEIVVIFVDFDDLVQTAALEGQGFGEHLIDGGAANDREMAEIVVIGLKQEGFLLNLIGQLDESQQMMLRKLAAAVVVDFDASNAVTVEGGGAVFAGVWKIPPLSAIENHEWNLDEAEKFGVVAVCTG